MSATFGIELGRELCHAVGLDPATVTDLTLCVSVHEPATLTVTRFVSGDDAEELVAVIEHYGLTMQVDEEAEQ